MCQCACLPARPFYPHRAGGGPLYSFCILSMEKSRSSSIQTFLMHPQPPLCHLNVSPSADHLFPPPNRPEGTESRVSPRSRVGAKDPRPSLPHRLLGGIYTRASSRCAPTLSVSVAALPRSGRSVGVGGMHSRYAPDRCGGGGCASVPSPNRLLSLLLDFSVSCSVVMQHLRAAPSPPAPSLPLHLRAHSWVTLYDNLPLPILASHPNRSDQLPPLLRGPGRRAGAPSASIVHSQRAPCAIS